MCWAPALGVRSQVRRGVGLNHSTWFVLVPFYQLILSGRTTQISRTTNLKLLSWGNFVLLITLEMHLTSVELVQFWLLLGLHEQFAVKLNISPFSVLQTGQGKVCWDCHELWQLGTKLSPLDRVNEAGVMQAGKQLTRTFQLISAQSQNWNHLVGSIIAFVPRITFPSSI